MGKCKECLKCLEKYARLDSWPSDILIPRLGGFNSTKQKHALVKFTRTHDDLNKNYAVNWLVHVVMIPMGGGGAGLQDSQDHTGRGP